ncbi:hypothetical protein F3087_24880 [Nocardia colli]|uniref:Uncharacterized protein n=1 Tax=Nocardia colli TaxID=2545717 RepID=A0A5N0E8W8_9NOCA|nr:hypothetical protein [Nocardia colli]KAA8885872.1 hypothetical protein F3087_24880 [Nocardia colli]
MTRLDEREVRRELADTKGDDARWPYAIGLGSACPAKLILDRLTIRLSSIWRHDNAGQRGKSKGRSGI